VVVISLHQAVFYFTFLNSNFKGTAGAIKIIKSEIHIMLLVERESFPFNLTENHLT
jgi:hypothetical protein